LKTVFVCESEDVKPFKKHYSDAGWDLRAAEDVVIPPGQRKLIKTGVRSAIPKGYYGQILPRSGLALNHGIMTMAGVVDSEYRDEIKVLLYNSGPEEFVIKRGDRIAQFVIIKINLDADTYLEHDIDIEEFLDTERGLKGFGSSGVK
jgi:dUTP pyrophosphatase